VKGWRGRLFEMAGWSCNLNRSDGPIWSIYLELVVNIDPSGIICNHKGDLLG